MSNWVDFVPALRYFPRWTMINRGKKLHKALVDTCDDLITDVQRRMKAGEAVPECLAKFLLTVKEQEELDWWDVAFICCAFMLGGVNTVSSLCVSVVGGGALMRLLSDCGGGAMVRCRDICASRDASAGASRAR